MNETDLRQKTNDAAERDDMFSWVSPTEDFEKYADEALVALAQGENGSEALDAMLMRYKSFVRGKARSYFLIGADQEDIVQEGMIGLYKAIRDYRPDRLASFHAFADICVTRQIITAIKTATRQKHIPLNNYVSLNRPVYEEDSDRTLMDIITDDTPSNPEEVLIDRESLSIIEGRIGTMLSELEKEVLVRYMEGKSYQQISEETGRHAKSIDNALQRIKKKLGKLIDERRKD